MKSSTESVTSTLGNTLASAGNMWSSMYTVIASEVSTITRYFDRTVQFSPLPFDSGKLLESLDSPKKSIAQKSRDLPIDSDEAGDRTAILINGNFNHDLDIQGTLQSVAGKMSRGTRLIGIFYSPYFAVLFQIASWMGLRQGQKPTTFLTNDDVEGLAKLSDLEIVRVRRALFCPWRLFGVGDLLNSVLPMVPGLRNFSLVNIISFRRRSLSQIRKPSLTVVIPARNERGNIENALKRMPDFGAPLEVIFVEGHSKDGTWAEIQRVQELYKDRYRIHSYQQTGNGKSDAVRLGFKHASNELLTILDADLTMPPEMLTRFYEAYEKGYADFVNGSRLVYPMEDQAMRFLNRLGNKFFAKALSAVLGTRLTDSLCGTKLVARRDYARMEKWREDFGDFDPFGDYELIFPAATMALGIVDIPIAYKNRVYGTTQIRRFYHGLMLLKMVWVGMWSILAGRIRHA